MQQYSKSSDAVSNHYPPGQPDEQRRNVIRKFITAFVAVFAGVGIAVAAPYAWHTLTSTPHVQHGIVAGAPPGTQDALIAQTAAPINSDIGLGIQGLINDTTKTNAAQPLLAAARAAPALVATMFSTTTPIYNGDATAAAVNTHTVINHSAIRGAPSSPATIASAQATSFNSTISAIMTAIRDRAAQPTILVAVFLSALGVFMLTRRRSVLSTFVHAAKRLWDVDMRRTFSGLSFG